jgi:heparanase
MPRKFVAVESRSAIVAVVLVIASVVPPQVRAQAVSFDPAKMSRIGTVDQRFASYNIEMAEVTGGKFWKPYTSKSAATAGATEPAQFASTPAGMDPNMYQYRPPIDLSNPRLRKLASGLGPTYVRVSGTWANSIYFANSDNSQERRRPRGSAVC